VLRKTPLPLGAVARLTVNAPDVSKVPSAAWRCTVIVPDVTPFVIACGTDETTEFVRQAQILWDAWSEVRRPVDGPLFIPGRDHFTVQLDHADAHSDLTLATLALF